MDLTVRVPSVQLALAHFYVCTVATYELCGTCLKHKIAQVWRHGL